MVNIVYIICINVVDVVAFSLRNLVLILIGMIYKYQNGLRKFQILFHPIHYPVAPLPVFNLVSVVKSDKFHDRIRDMNQLSLLYPTTNPS